MAEDNYALINLHQHDQSPYSAPADDRLDLMLADAQEHAQPPTLFLLPTLIRDACRETGQEPPRSFRGVPVRYYGGDLVILLCGEDSDSSFRCTAVRPGAEAAS